MILGVFDFLIDFLLRFTALDRRAGTNLARFENLRAEFMLLFQFPLQVLALLRMLLLPLLELSLCGPRLHHRAHNAPALQAVTRLTHLLELLCLVLAVHRVEGLLRLL